MVKKGGNKASTSGLAITSLVLGILALYPVLGVILGIVGIILGIVALNKIKKTGLQGKNLAIAGIILSIIGIIITIVLVSLAFSHHYAKDGYRKNYPADADKFIGNTTYENTYCHFRFTYPTGSVFASAHPDSGFIVRFFFPNGQTIAGDEENIGLYVQENFLDIDTELRYLNNYAKNGPIDVKEITLGGQRGYKVEFTSDYTSKKGTQEMAYFTVKNNILYELNYFPVVNDNLKIADSVANSFEFISTP